MIGPLVAGVTILTVTGLTTGHWVAADNLPGRLPHALGLHFLAHLMERGVSIHPLLVLSACSPGPRSRGLRERFSRAGAGVARIVYVRIRKAREARVAIAGST